MPNGAYDPHCLTCDFFNHKKRKYPCQKHLFIFPEIGSQVICADYKHHNETSSISQALPPGQLFALAYGNSKSPQSLGTFPDLKHAIFSAAIHNDIEKGWAIYLHDRRISPVVNTSIKLLVDKQVENFLVVEESRILATGGTRLNDGTWKVNYRNEQKRILYSPPNPQLLYEWVNALYDLEAYNAFIEAHPMKENVRDFGISIYLKEERRNNQYLLIPDLTNHINTFRRNKKH